MTSVLGPGQVARRLGQVAGTREIAIDLRSQRVAPLVGQDDLEIIE